MEDNADTGRVWVALSLPRSGLGIRTRVLSNKFKTDADAVDDVDIALNGRLLCELPDGCAAAGAPTVGGDPTAVGAAGCWTQARGVGSAGTATVSGVLLECVAAT
jgi:hypothetical protein